MSYNWSYKCYPHSENCGLSVLQVHGGASVLPRTALYSRVLSQVGPTKLSDCPTKLCGCPTESSKLNKAAALQPACQPQHLNLKKTITSALATHKGKCAPPPTHEGASVPPPTHT